MITVGVRASTQNGLQCTGALSQFNQPPRSTQPGHPSVGRRNHRSKGGDALRLGSKGRYGVVCR